ncbi:MAG: SCP2 sterol-binding domain-containing protein [Lachnospiraceae bacterium]|nr:SCP2 sterol-binding domain-containing protein [Lachnospiraceae bacterium]
MKINIYYGGRGLIGDPTLYVIGIMQQVLEELHVTVERYQLCEMKSSITTLPQTMKDADGIILATTVEWYGIGGYMQQFLDACWLYGDKDRIARIYMCPVVMSTTYGEREGKLNLANAWEILGGLPCSGICGYIADYSSFENNEDYKRLIEKKAENLYRCINQKMPSFPASNQAVKQKVSSTKDTDLTPQESEQLSQYAADDGYVQRQKEDIRELTCLFRDKMGEVDEDDESLISLFEQHFTPVPGVHLAFKFTVEEKKAPLFITVNNGNLECTTTPNDRIQADLQLSEENFENIARGRMTFQRAFLVGNMSVKGDFGVTKLLDQIFNFS